MQCNDNCRIIFTKINFFERRLFCKNLSNKYKKLVLRQKKERFVYMEIAILEILWKWPLNIATIVKTRKSLMKKIYEQGCIEKFNQKNHQNNISLTSDLQKRLVKQLMLKQKYCLNIIQ